MVKQTTRKDDKPNLKNLGVRKDDKAVKVIMPPKVRVTFQLSAELVERVRDVVFFTPGLTMTRLLTEALIATLERIERENGGRFASRGNFPLRTGRPVKAT